MPDVHGRPLHTRSLTIVLSRESDGLWHARGDVVDLRKTGFVPMLADIQPAGVIHMMSIGLAFDIESLRIESIDVDQPFVAIEPSERTGGECCRDPAPRLLALRGETLDSRFAKRLGTTFGGVLGCSHLLTLFQLMASTLPRAVEIEKARASSEGTSHPIGFRFFRRSVFIDGHERDPASIDVGLQLSDTHTRPVPPDSGSTDRLALFHEVKALARIDRKRFRVEALRARERRRDAGTLSKSEWISRDDRVSGLVDGPLIPGMAGRIFARLGGDADVAPLRDLLLQLAPGFIQISAALMDGFFEEKPSSESTSKSAEKPMVASIGGNTNSCYMWREDGPATRASGIRTPSPSSD
ncbi:MAG TPA: DUF2889 domain-containing protein [Deltaproteobacteria bacterium]|nr:DUF2889 domain-containing protein [Deltaproteobacteria bacterium]